MGDKKMNYNYDYGNYTPSVNSGYTGMYGYDKKMNYKGDKANITFMSKDNVGYMSNNNQQLVQPYLGLIRGNLFDNQYEPYRNYKPMEIEVNNEISSLLGQIQMYNFAVVDLNLYLDTNPNDKKALQLLKEYAKTEKELWQQYEMKYGPLMVNNITANNFNWIDNPWPWEEIK